MMMMMAVVAARLARQTRRAQSDDRRAPDTATRGPRKDRLLAHGGVRPAEARRVGRRGDGVVDAVHTASSGMPVGRAWELKVGRPAMGSSIHGTAKRAGNRRAAMGIRVVEDQGEKRVRCLAQCSQSRVRWQRGVKTRGVHDLCLRATIGQNGNNQVIERIRRS